MASLVQGVTPATHSSAAQTHIPARLSLRQSFRLRFKRKIYPLQLLFLALLITRLGRVAEDLFLEVS